MNTLSTTQYPFHALFHEYLPFSYSFRYGIERVANLRNSPVERFIFSVTITSNLIQSPEVHSFSDSQEIHAD